jgi:uncharacterized coiled-coil protein SlyX
MSNIVNEHLFKINQLDYTDSYGKYDLNNITGKLSYDKYLQLQKSTQRVQKSSNGNSANKYKLDSIILQPDTQSILLSSDSILNFINKKTISERLKLNGAYIIHAIEYKYLDYRKNADGYSLIPLDQKEILFIDNYCNYHIIRSDVSTEEKISDFYNVIPNDEVKHIKLPDQIIDIIKKLNGCQILGFNYNYNNIYTLLDGIGKYVLTYYNVQNQKIELHENTTIDLTTKLETNIQTIAELSSTVSSQESTINNLNQTVSDNETLINSLQDTINKLNKEKAQIQNQSDKYREEIRQYKFNNILYIESIE